MAFGSQIQEIGEGYIPKVSLQKECQYINKKSLLFEVFRPLVSSRLCFPNLALVGPSITGQIHVKPEDASAWEDAGRSSVAPHMGRAFYGLNWRALIPANLPEIALAAQRSPSAVARGPGQQPLQMQLGCPHCLLACFIEKFKIQ